MNDRPHEHPESADADGAPVKASDMLGMLLAGGMPETVSLGWLTERLHERSFGAYMLTLGAIGILPFASIPVGILIAILAVQVILGSKNPIMPSFIAKRPIAARRIKGFLQRAIGVVRRFETFIHPRWHVVFRARLAIGLTILVLALTLLIPIPFSNVVPALAIALVALAYIEKDGLLLLLSLAGGIASVAILVEVIWRIV